MLRRQLSIILLALAPRLVLAQCPDGAPPPCRGARVLPPAAERARRFLLLPFRNVSRAEGDAWLVKGAQVLLADAIGQWRELTIVPDEQLSAVMRRRRLATDAVPDADQLQQLAQETGGWTAVTGDVVTAGRVTRISARAIDVPTRRVLARTEEQVAAGEDVRPAFDRVALRLLEAAGLEARPSDLAARTTQSIDAYRAYVRGVTLTGQSAFRRARLAFEEAVRLDSGFAQAWARLAYASVVWNGQVLLDPRSDAYRYAERAAALAPKLPERQRGIVIAMASIFRGQFTEARRGLEQLVATDSADLDALEMLSLFEMIDPILDSAAAPRLRASLNRGTMLARRLLSLAPDRRHVYAIFLYANGTAAGIWGGGLIGYRREASSLGGLFLTRADAFFVPVLRDSFIVMRSDSFYALPQIVRDSVRRRALDAASTWVERWLAAGPGDGEAWMWASRVASTRQDYEAALRAVIVAESLGVESRMENPAAQRMRFLANLGRLGPAASLADSLAASGYFRSSWVLLNPLGEHPDSWAAAILLAGARWARAYEVAIGARTGLSPRAACRRVADVLYQVADGPLRNALADSAIHNALALQAGPLGPCVPDIAYTAQRDSVGERLVAQRFAVMAESLALRGNFGVATRFANSALIRDTTLAARLSSATWYLERVDRLRNLPRIALSAISSGDSLSLDWTWRDRRPLTWDDPDFPNEPFLRVSFTRSDTSYGLHLGHPYPAHESRREGSPAELLAELTIRNAYVGEHGRIVRGVTPTSVTAAPALDGFRVVLRGGVADAVRAKRPVSLTLESQPCLRDPRAIADRCQVEVPVTYR